MQRTSSPANDQDRGPRHFIATTPHFYLHLFAGADDDTSLGANLHPLPKGEGPPPLEIDTHRGENQRAPTTDLRDYAPPAILGGGTIGTVLD